MLNFLYRFSGVAVLLGLLAGVSLILPPRQFYPSLQWSTADDVTLQWVASPVSDERACADQLALLRNRMAPSLPDSASVLQRCVRSPDRVLAHMLSNFPLPATSLRLGSTVLVFSGGQSDAQVRQCEALRAADTSAKAGKSVLADTSVQAGASVLAGTSAQPGASAQQASAQPQAGASPQAIARRIAENCTEANAPRPWSAPQQDSYASQSRLLAGCIGLALVGLLTLAIAVRRGHCAAALILSDALALWIGLVLVTWTRHAWYPAIEGTPPPLLLSTLFTHALLTGATLLWLGWVAEHYSRRRPFWDEFSESVRILATIFLLACTVSFLARIDVARGTLLLVWGSALALIPTGRYVTRGWLRSLGKWERPALIVGVGDNAVEAVDALRSEANLGYCVTAFVRSGLPDEQEAASLPRHDLPVLGAATPTIAEVVAVLAARANAQIVVAVESLSTSEAALLIQALSLRFGNIHVIPTIRGLPLFGTSLSHFFRHEVLFLTLRNSLQQRGVQALKRLFDIAGSGMLLVLLSPVLLMLGLMVMREGGQPLFAHARIGRFGKPFPCLKFRSMRRDSAQVLERLLASDPAARAEWESEFKLKVDPRITPIGHFLRRTSLDELPQLWNVFCGEMSLVGPRPIIEKELARYGDQVDLYLNVRPGMTGLWQVSGRNDINYEERVALDTWYVQNWSLWYDVAILFKTIEVVLQRRGAY